MLQWLALAALVALVAAGCVSAADAQQYDPTKDFDTLDGAGNNEPFGIWSDGATMWVTDFDDEKIYAYKMSDMSLDPSKNFETLAAGNANPAGIWSDGTTMWVADYFDGKIYAYKMSDKSRDTSKEFDMLDGDNTDLAGIWSDGATMWVADYTDDKIYAYHMSDMSRDTSKDFDTLDGAGNNEPFGIWSDGTTMWVADYIDEKIFAYKMSDKSNDPSKEFDMLDDDNENPAGIWSDGTTMWVADYTDDKIYAYRMPGAPVASTGPPPLVYTYLPLPDTTPPTVKSVERTGNATTTDRALMWDVTFSESVVVRAGVHTSHTSVSNATIPDLGAVYDTMLVDVPGVVTGGSVSVDLHHPIISGLLIELVAPDCTAFVIHNQTVTFPYKLRQPYDLGDLAGVGAAGQWTLHVSDHAKWWNGTLNAWNLELESEGVVEGSGTKYTITQYAAGPGEYTLSFDGYVVRDRAGHHLADADPKINEPYRVVGEAARTCQTE